VPTKEKVAELQQLVEVEAVLSRVQAIQWLVWLA